MRLWHYALLPLLPKQWLQGQHRECCALRGLGWGKKHATVDYVFEHSYLKLYLYHIYVMTLLLNESVSINDKWMNVFYRGKKLGIVDSLPNTTLSREEVMETLLSYLRALVDKTMREIDIAKQYEEHNDEYLIECIMNLREKGLIFEGFRNE